MTVQRLGADQEAVSTVVSAVLVFSLLIVVMSVYTSTILPDQAADAEATHLRHVASAFGDAASQMSDAVTLHREGQFAAQVDLGTSTQPALFMQRSSGAMKVEEAGFFTDVACGHARLVARDGHAAPGAGFEPFGASAGDVRSFSIVTVKLHGYTFGVFDDAATITVSSDTGPVASFEVALLSGGTLQLTTRDAASNIVFQQVLQSNLGPTVDAYVIDAMSPVYGFSSLMGDSSGPFALTSTATASGLEVYAVYTTSEGTLGEIGEGRDLGSLYERTQTSQDLVYRSSNAHFLQQTYALEGVGVVLEQPNGQVLSTVPFSLRVASGQSLVHLTLVNLTGSGQVSGSNRAAVTADVTNPVSSTLQCADATVVTGSAYPEAWLQAWRQALGNAGLDESAATRNGDTVTVHFAGPWTTVIDEARALVRVA